MWMWILISVVVVPILVVGAAALFMNAISNAFSPFSGADRTLFRWPDAWWPKKTERRFPLSYECIDKADWNKPPPDLSLAEIETAVAAFSDRAEAVYGAHKGAKPEHGAEILAEARSARAKAVVQRQRGDELDAWSSYNDVCKNYAFLLDSLKPPS